MMEVIRRGEIWVANLNPNRGREIGKIRPVLVIQSDELTAIGAEKIVVLPMTTQVHRCSGPPGYAFLRKAINLSTRHW